MRGTQCAGSLLRLFLCAAFLCLAWVLLASSRAEAAERPAPVGLVASAAEPVKASVPGVAGAKAVVAVQPRAATVPSPRPALRAALASVLPTSEAVTPLVDRLRAKTAASVDASADGLKSLGAAVPVVDAPVAAAADAVVTLTNAVPVVGRDPLVQAPLPGVPIVPLPGTSLGVDVSESGESVEAHANSSAGQGIAPAPAATTVVPRQLALASFESDVPRPGVGAAVVADRTPTAADMPRPSGPPEPPPSPQSPMPPAHSSHGGGGGGATGDGAAAGHAVVLLSPTSWAIGSTAWRVPRGPSAQPGLRPD